MNRLQKTVARAVGSCRRKFFSLRRANRSLVLVRKVTADIVAEYPRLLELQEMLELAQCRGSVEYLGRLQADLAGAVARLQDLIGELESVGVELCDFGRGMVDFPAFVAGREVRFCWQFGEERIGHWHRAHEDTASRRPISELMPAAAPKAAV